MRTIRFALIVLFLVPALLLGACGGGQKEPTAAEIIERTAKAVEDASTFSFRIDTEGGPAYIGGGRTMSLNWAEGTVKRPDSAIASLNVAALSMVLEIQFVSIGQDQYWTNPLTKNWEKAPVDFGYSPAVLFDSDRGIPGVLRKIKNVELAGRQSVDGRDTYHLTGIISGADAQDLTGGALVGDNRIEVWSDVENFRPAQVKVQQPAAGAEEPTTWTFKLSRFNEPIDIKPPVQ